MAQSFDVDLSMISYFSFRRMYHSVQRICETGLRKRTSDPKLLFWKAFAVAKQAYDDARAILKRIVEGNGSRDRRSTVNVESGGDQNVNFQPGSLLGFAFVLMGWIDLKCQSESLASKSVKWFDRVLEHNPRDLDRRQLTPALDITSQVIVYYPSFIPAYVERMNVLFEMAAWDQVLEAAQRLSSVSPDSLDATTALCLVELCKEGRVKVAANHLSTLNQILSKFEPDPDMFCTMARHLRVFSNRALPVDLHPEKCDYKTELGYVQLYMGNISKAREYFKLALTLNSNANDAMQVLGLIRCLIYSGDMETAEEQLEFFEALHNSGLVAWYKNKNRQKMIQLLKDAFLATKKKISQTSMNSGEEPASILILANEVLEEAIKIMPGSSETLLYQARVKFLLGDMIMAQNIALKCLRIDPSFLKAHILLSEVYLSLGQPKQSIQSLEMGLSYNFEVRQIPIFHILKSKSLKMQGQYEDALQVLKFAMGLPSVRDFSLANARLPQIKPSETSITIHENVTLYLEMADIHSKLKHAHEAAKVIEDAMRLFRGTPEQDRIILANTELLIGAGEIDTALNILSSITSDQSVYLDAKKRLADIYLNHKGDKKAYAKCYSDILEQNYSVDTCLLLGDAYMNIQEPNKAISIYERALDSNPSDAALACKLGRALVRVHDYQRAIRYYEAALSNDSPASGTLKYDLAELYLKLKQYEDTERVALDALEHRDGNDSLYYEQDVKLHKLTAKAYIGLQLHDKALSALLKAKEIQLRLLAKDSGSVENTTQKGIASYLCFEIAELYAKNLKDPQMATEFYNESIQHNSMQVKSMISLSRMYMNQGDMNAAQSQCAALLRLDPTNEDATLMIADVMFRKNSLSSAIFHFRQLLEKNPTNFKALRQLVEMMKRAGKLEEAVKFFEMAEKSSMKANLHPGYHFCKGLHYSPNEALKAFNVCRRDVEWGEEALHNMIEIFLNPDNETLGGDALERVNDESSIPSSDKTDSELLAILTADKLIKELPQHPKSIKTQIYECYAWMATKQKYEIERALNTFTEILNTQKEYIPALLGIAVAHMLLKQPPRARNQLKRIAKMEWGGKFDLATELLKKVLAQNKSCAKAWEYMGFIMEKEASYKDAAEHYESAWKLERESNPSIGYKLALIT
ncbi:hypothetical protein BC829DRAFT_420632 [Chytridium lagenaria]|nr:hypothetical protein BC829DRAFT_420632 [Chytridium lagenaria]